MKYKARITHTRTDGGRSYTVYADCTVVESDVPLNCNEPPFYYQVEEQKKKKKEAPEADRRVFQAKPVISGVD